MRYKKGHDSYEKTNCLIYATRKPNMTTSTAKVQTHNWKKAPKECGWFP